MASLREFARDPSVAEAAERLTRSVARAQSERMRADAAEFTLDLEPTAMEIEAPRRFRRPEPLLGAGVVIVDGNEHPAIVVEETSVPELPSGRAVALSDVDLPSVRNRLSWEVDGQPDPRSVVLAVPAPVPQFACGHVVTCSGRQGTLGAWVRDHTGARRITTAGHVVTGVGATVHDLRRGVALVEAFEDPAMAPNGQIVADLAVLRVLSGTSSAGVVVGGSATPKGGDPLVCQGAASRGTHGAVMGFLPYVSVERMSGQWGNTYMTRANMSMGGDSGAPVFLGETDRIVGHLVGGSGDVTSWIQDIDYQLGRFGLSLA